MDERFKDFVCIGKMCIPFSVLTNPDGSPFTSLDKRAIQADWIYQEGQKHWFEGIILFIKNLFKNL